MKKILVAIGISFSLLPTVASAATPANAFRRPLDDVLSPAISAHYDNDTSNSAKNYLCGTATVYNNHRGTDFRAPVGTPVYAAKNGYLYYRFDSCPTYGFQGSACGGGFGNHVRIDHESPFTDGRGIVTIYAHLKQNTAATIDEVNCGALIGQTGTSGNSTGPHLHFEVRKYGYPNDDPFSGTCSGSMSYWVDQGNGLPVARCQ